MERKVSFSSIIYLIVFTVVLHFIGSTFGIYDAQIKNGVVWFDNLLHFLNGAASALLWFWIIQKKSLNSGAAVKIISVILFAFFFAFAWELIEFLFFKIFTEYAYNFHIYSPSISEAFEDIVSNTLGAIVLLIFWLKWYK